MRFSDSDVLQFAEWSGDRNPLHTDASHARRTHFGRPIVHGMLSVIAALREVPDAAAIRHLDIEFRGAILKDADYDLSCIGSGGHFDLSVTGEGHNQVLSVQASNSFENKAPLDLSWASSDLSSQRGEPADWSIEDLKAGVEFAGTYSNSAVTGISVAPTFAQTRVLALCSYVIGMELPGRRSLFTRATVDFFETSDVAPTEPLTYRVRSKRFDAQFRLLDLELTVVRQNRQVLATASLRSYVPFSPVDLDLDALGAWIEPQVETLSGKVAWVVGGTRGLGAELSAALALAGCQVYATGRSAADANAEWMQEIRDNLHPLLGDAADADWCRKTVAAIRERHGSLDLLILNACESPEAILLGAGADDDFDRYVSRNVRLVRAPLAAWLSLPGRTGRIVYVSSTAATTAPTGWAHYAAVKQAGESLVKAALQEHPDLAAVIARPGALQTTWSDTPARAVGAIPAGCAAAHIVNAVAHAPAGEARILTNFPALRKPVRNSSGDGLHVALTATFTADPLVAPLEFWLDELGVAGRIVVAPYGQTLQTLLDPSSSFSTNSKGGNVILLRTRDFLRELPPETIASADAVEHYLREVLTDFEGALRAHRGRARTDTLLVLCPGFDGDQPHAALLAKAQGQLVEAVSGLPGLRIVTASEWHEHYGVEPRRAGDRVREKLGHIPYSESYYSTLATVVARHLHKRLAPRRKVVVVDCDNTLWRGVVGEVGAEGLQFDEAHRALHAALRALHESGVLVALCSKNEEPDVWRVFETRPELGLTRDQIVAAAINWQPKSENLRRLATRLNLGLDSFIFIDDNPVECAEVRARCPEVLTLEWPLDSAEAVKLVQHTWELDTESGTAEDQRRTEMYREEFRRQELRDGALSFSDFIDNLQLQVDVGEIGDDDVARASQLTLRTNQFNFTTRRRDESEMKALLADSRYVARTIKVRDRFGDYGFVGLLIAERDETRWTVDTFLLSCRVLGRGVEHRLIAELARMAHAGGASSVELRVEFTKRNTPARTFLESIASPESIERGERGITCTVSPAALLDLRFEPANQEAHSAEVVSAGPTTPAAGTGDALRHRERQIRRTALALSDAATLAAAIHGEAPPAMALQGGDDVNTVVLDAFAAALKIPAAQVEEVDRLEALGCDSMKIVEITVALIERFPALPSTLLFEHRSVSAIVREIEKIAGGVQKSDARPIDAHAASSGSDSGALDIAVVGMHVRCAGARSPLELWNLLSEGRSAVSPVPPDREHFFRPLEDDRPHWAGLLDEVGTFEPEFFGISPREAEVMDPQLRLFLEIAWGALEDAGYAGCDLEPETGVFVGVMYGDYAERANEVTRETGSPYRSWEGFSLANRLSQVLNLHGPSLAVDTACSSSGTALHLACRALKAGDCKAAVVGGVNLILDPDRFGSLGRLGILSLTGRCLPFGADADGTVLGEGAGVVVLRPLQDALRRGDRVYGVIKGSGLSTGHGTVGFTAPNPQAQATAIERALRTSAVDPRTISYIETHGTGTALGDPIEVRGLALAFEQVPTVDSELQVEPAWTIGSIKPNIGHLEAGAGVVSLIKVLLQLHRRMLLPSITSDTPNPQIPFATSPFAVQRQLTPWQPRVAHRDGVETVLPRRAGLSSFGVGGANAHFVIEEAPETPGVTTVARPGHLLALSARSRRGLENRAEELAAFLATNPETDFADVCHTANTGRAHFEHRLAVHAATRDELIEALGKATSDATVDSLHLGNASRYSSGVAFLFTGQGAQYVGMGRVLYETHPVFREAMDACASILDDLLPQPLLSVVFAPKGTPAAALLDQTGFTQPALFAIQYALAQLWKSWGIEPSVVMGHSVGEFAALCIAGGVSLEDGLKLVAARGRLMQALPEGGTMASVMTSEDRVRSAIGALSDHVSVAAINGPKHVVISGAASSVATVVAVLDAEGIRTKPLTVSHAFHSPLMQPMLDEYERVVREITFSTPRVPLVSSVTGAVVTNETMLPDYWIQQIMQPVQFTRAVESIAATGASTWLEIGPQPVLIGMAQRCVSATDDLWLTSIRRDADDWRTLLDSAAQLYVAGHDFDWRGFDAPYHRHRVTLPAYPFGGKRYWISWPPAASNRNRSLPATTESDQDPASTPRTYELTWRKQAHAAVGSTNAAQQWLLVGDPGGFSAALADRLRAAGHTCTIAPTADAARTLVSKGPLSVVYLHALDETGVTSPPASANETLLGALQLVQTMAAGAPATPVWFVTAGATAVGEGESISLAQAPVWGFARTIAGEQPGNWGGLIDLSNTSPAEAEISALLRQLLAPDGEDQIALRGSHRFVARLVESRDDRPAPAFHASEGTYLVTGGLGALGLEAARWLVFKGARHLVLASRNPRRDANTDVTLEELRRLGADVTVRRLDVSDPADVTALVSSINEGPAPLRGVLHAAGVDLVRPVTGTTAEQLREVTAAKIDGAWNLHTATEGLDLFVCFSSISALLGSSGRAAYSAANAFMDALARERHHCGLPALSVNWGPWRGGGMATDEQLQQLERMGNRALLPKPAIKALDHALRSNAAQVCIADVEWETFRSVYEARRPRPLLSELGPQNRVASQPVSSSPQEFDLVSILREEAALTLGFDNGADLSVDRRFSDMGMDSLLAADFAGRLRKRLGHVPAGAVFDHPSVRALASHLQGTLAPAAVGAEPALAAVATVSCVTAASGMEKYSPAIEADVLTFQREAFPTRAPELIAPRWRWMFVDSARRIGVEPLFWIHRDRGRIVGQMGSIPVRVKIGSETHVAYWLVDTMVLEEYRSQAIGSRLMLQAQEDAPFSLSLGQTAEVRKMQAHLGWSEPTPLQVHQLLVRPERVLEGKLPGVAATVAGMALRASSATRVLFRKRPAMQWRAISRFDASHDALWERAANDLPCAVVRDASYLNWKYVDQPGQDFLRLELVDEAGDIAGVAIWMLRAADEQYAYSRAHLVDVIAPLSNSEMLDRVIQSACDVAAEAGADSLIGMTTDSRVGPALGRSGFMRREPGRYLLVDTGTLGTAVRELARDGRRWFITQGDSDIDRPW